MRQGSADSLPAISAEVREAEHAQAVAMLDLHRAFAAVERHALGPLPHNAFQIAVWSTGKAATDCHVKDG